MENIKQQLTSQDEDTVLAALKRIRIEQKEEVMPILLDLLANTQINSMRNASAMALSDLNVPELVSVVSRLLQNESLLSCAGTLIYALRNLDYSLILSELAWIVDKGSYETTLMVIMLCEDLPDNTDNYKIVLALDILKRKLPNQQNKIKRKYIQKAIRTLEGYIL